MVFSAGRGERSQNSGGGREAFVGAFGKLPKVGDFVRIRMVGEPMKSLEMWVEQAMGWGAQRRGSQWTSVYGTGAIHAFVYRLPASVHSGVALAGIIRPSVDLVGRKFPMVIFSPFEERALEASPHLAPLVLGDFLEQAAEVVMQSPQMSSASLLEERLQNVHPPRLDLVAQSRREYNAWTQGTLLEGAWGAIYGDSRSAQALHAIHTIYEAVAPFRGRDNPNTPLSVRLPLGVGGAGATAFWIDVVRCIARWTEMTPIVFWSSDGISGSVLVQLGEVPSSTLAELWSPDPHSEHVCDLTAPSSVDRSRFLGRLPPHVAESLDRPATLVAQFLQTLEVK